MTSNQLKGFMPKIDGETGPGIVSWCCLIHPNILFAMKPSLSQGFHEGRASFLIWDSGTASEMSAVSRRPWALPRSPSPPAVLRTC